MVGSAVVRKVMHDMVSKFIDEHGARRLTVNARSLEKVDFDTRAWFLPVLGLKGPIFLKFCLNTVFYLLAIMGPFFFEFF